MGKSFVEQLLKDKKANLDGDYEAGDEELHNVVPHVCELLTRKLRDGKRTIEPGSLTIFCRKQSWHACLTHKGLDLKWWGEGATMKDALDALEAAIGQDEGQEANGSKKTRSGTV